MKYLIDLDGTLMDQTKPNLDAVEFISELRLRKTDFRIMTNSIKSPGVIAERLNNAGMAVAADHILNPITAINSFLDNNGVKSAYIVGSVSEIEQVNVRHSDHDPEYVALLDFEKNNTTYDELQRIFVLIQKGVPVISASGSLFYFKDSGKYLDTGSFVNLLERAAGIEIRILGKPSREYFQAGLHSLKANCQEVTVIGDDWNTDIQGATNASCFAILVRSGKYQPGDELKCKPTRVVNTLMEIINSA
ncbi:MAG: HAD hydrolase-like protein [Leptolinea sp.]|nr:HAD hydrolase-like protein [Leptolinea sp.]